MSSLSWELRDLIESGPMAHLSTINADGSPQVTVIWIGLDGDNLVSAHMSRHVKLRNIERDPRGRVVVRCAAGARRRHESVRRIAGTGSYPAAERRRMGFAQPLGEGLYLPGRRVPAAEAPRLHRALLRGARRRCWPLGVDVELSCGSLASAGRRRVAAGFQQVLERALGALG
jgi:hypothetical protein